MQAAIRIESNSDEIIPWLPAILPSVRMDSPGNQTNSLASLRQPTIVFMTEKLNDCSVGKCLIGIVLQGP